MSTDGTDEKNDYCPSKEELSNWYDNGGDETIKSHLDVCRPCEDTVSFYRRVDETVCTSSEAPDYLAGDIAEACRNIEHETLVFPLWMRVVRIAAVVAVVGTVAAVVQLVTSPKGGPDTRLITEGETAPGGNHIVIAEYKGPVPAAPDKTPHFENAESVAQLQPLSGNDLMAVSADGGRERHETAKNTTLIPVAQAVRHVWAVGDVKAAQDVLINTLPKGVREPKFARISDEKLTFEATMSDKQLQTFVNDLQAKGWALFTKDYPQPGKEDETLLTGHPVMYQAELVKKVD